MKISGLLVLVSLLLSCTALAATPPAGKDNTAAHAEAFVQLLGQQKFAAVEAEFTGRMKQAAPVGKLKTMWHRLTAKIGAFEGTGKTETSHYEGHTMVVVDTRFSKKTLGIRVVFDQAGDKVAGFQFVPAI